MKRNTKTSRKNEKKLELEPRFARIADAFAKDKLVTMGRMMSSYVLKVNGKIFALSGHNGRFVVKLPKVRVDELAESGRGKNFEPGPGHVMKEWVVILDKTADWLELAREAYQFVKQTT
jgi:hypothetical protein